MSPLCRNSIWHERTNIRNSFDLCSNYFAIFSPLEVFLHEGRVEICFIVYSTLGGN